MTQKLPKKKDGLAKFSRKITKQMPMITIGAFADKLLLKVRIIA